MTIEPKFPGASRPASVAVIGSGISGLSAAWLLSRTHRVTLFEAEKRLGGHSNTVMAGDTPVDTGFIVYNKPCYPNLTALFDHFNVETVDTDMSFAVSLDDGRLEYSGRGLSGLFAQKRNLTSPRFFFMLSELARFYRQAPRDIDRLGMISLDDYLAMKAFGSNFRDDHLYPMAAAIWSTPAADIGKYPAAAFIRFCRNHGLLQFLDRPIWRTVKGGSRNYVKRLEAELLAAPDCRILKDRAVAGVRRSPAGAEVREADGRTHAFDEVVFACHADETLRLLQDPSPDESRVLGSFSYTKNTAVLHSDPALMPSRRKAWAAWNYASTGRGSDRRLSVTYWMNMLQHIPETQPLFVTLNPFRAPAAGTIVSSHDYRHPQFNLTAMKAQHDLWSLQGQRNSWFCGAYFGAGFHEDGLQAGLAVAEALGGVRRPWNVAGESDRIILGPSPQRQTYPLEAAS